MFQPQSPQHYYKVGWQGLLLVEQALGEVGVAAPARILDLPSGYGRVLRFLRARYPDVEIVAGEIDHDAVNFCVSAHGAKPLYCENPLSRVDLLGEYDVIWSGSLFTHFSAEQWDDALPHLARSLTRRGVLVFTTHGDFGACVLAGNPLALSQAPQLVAGYGVRHDQRAVAFEAFHSEGFGYARYVDGDQHYGVSLSQPEWVRKALSKSGLRAIVHIARGWDAHQDAYFCVRADAATNG